MIIDVDTYEELEKYLRTEKLTFYNAMIDEIDDSLKNDYDIAHIARVYLANGVRIKIDLYREKWGYTLEQCLEYFEDLEDYERCTDINNIIKDINAS